MITPAPEARAASTELPEWRLEIPRWRDHDQAGGFEFGVDDPVEFHGRAPRSSGRSRWSSLTLRITSAMVLPVSLAITR
jgi:hypothetical protein